MIRELTGIVHMYGCMLRNIIRHGNPFGDGIWF